MSDESQTPLEDHIRRAIELLERGPRMLLDSLPNDPSMMSSSFSPETAKELARRLRRLAECDARLEIDHYFEMIPKDERDPNAPIFDRATGKLTNLRRVEASEEERADRLGGFSDAVGVRDIKIQHLMEVIADFYQALKAIEENPSDCDHVCAQITPELMECGRFYSWSAKQKEFPNAEEETSPKA